MRRGLSEAMGVSTFGSIGHFVRAHLRICVTEETPHRCIRANNVDLTEAEIDTLLESCGDCT